MVESIHMLLCCFSRVARSGAGFAFIPHNVVARMLCAFVRLDYLLGVEDLVANVARPLRRWKMVKVSHVHVCGVLKEELLWAGCTLECGDFVSLRIHVLLNSLLAVERSVADLTVPPRSVAHGDSVLSSGFLRKELQWVSAEAESWQSVAFTGHMELGCDWRLESRRAPLASVSKSAVSDRAHVGIGE